MSTAQTLIDTAKRYFQRHPEELTRLLRGALGLRLGVPLDAVRWLAEQASRSGAARDIEIETVPPGFRVAASIDLMKTPVRASAVVFIERVRVNADEIRVEVRLEEVSLKLTAESWTPVAMLIKSGALDLSRPGNLVRHLPQPPPFLIEARDNRIVLDFLKHPKLGGNPMMRHVVSLLTSLVTLHSVETDERHLDIAFRAFPSGLAHAARSVRDHFAPVMRGVRALLPSGAGHP
jgi:hypothetical protein